MAYSDETREKKKAENAQDQKNRHQDQVATADVAVLAAGADLFWDLYSRPRGRPAWTLVGSGYMWGGAHAAALKHQGSSVAIVPSGEKP